MEQSLTKIGEEVLTQLQCLRKSLKLNDVDLITYTPEQTQYIKFEMARLLLARQETVDSMVIDEWINTFRELHYIFYTVIQRIRTAKVTKRYGNQTTLADFTDIELLDYYKHYKEIKPTI